jgi:hypothetical protein
MVARGSRKSGEPMLFPGGRDCALVRKGGTSLVQLLQVQPENTITAFDAQDLDTSRPPEDLELS